MFQALEVRDGSIYPALRIAVVRVKDFFGNEATKYVLESAPVNLISDTATIYNLPDHLLYWLPHDLLTIVIIAHHVTDNGEAGVEITFIKLILNVPAKGPEFAPFLNDGMEETQRVLNNVLFRRKFFFFWWLSD